jgi:hypothetical protein
MEPWFSTYWLWQAVFFVTKYTAYEVRIVHVAVLVRVYSSWDIKHKYQLSINESNTNNKTWQECFCIHRRNVPGMKIDGKIHQLKSWTDIRMHLMNEQISIYTANINFERHWHSDKVTTICKRLLTQQPQAEWCGLGCRRHGLNADNMLSLWRCSTTNKLHWWQLNTSNLIYY